MDDKTKSIVAHLSWVGCIIALIMNESNREENTSFYIRQNLGLNFLMIIASILLQMFGGLAISRNGIMLIGIILLVFWAISIVGAVKGIKQPIPIFGETFQRWFKIIK